MIGTGVRDSCGSSGTGETPQEHSDKEAHRPPRGKRAPGEKINDYCNKVYENSLK
ncbi:hypothetical protein J2S17_005045 [Cytobacillus purgationiresistens]|uniref:Uncharacterized protein n=1 Tax=Cytobacillus purgationiresistens TaxID=863449 RepID=A0ABU0AQS0_9BACI|nr:hypothetical protein [Cytobacillus purgationiresistens]